jgi:hypothetical protein
MLFGGLKMGTGFLEVVTTTALGGMPVVGARVTVFSGDTVLYELVTDESGLTDTVALEAPARELSEDVNYYGIPYSVCDVKAEAEGFITVKIHDVEILDTETSILPIHMTPAMEKGEFQDLFIPPHNLVSEESRRMDVPPETGIVGPRVLSEVIIPEFITVHLGRPDNPNARNVRVPFTYYIKNSASHEIFSTWPPASLEANIYCIISLTLNRIFTDSHRLGRYKKWREYGVCWQYGFAQKWVCGDFPLYMYFSNRLKENAVDGDGVFLFGRDSFGHGATNLLQGINFSKSEFA